MHQEVSVCNIQVFVCQVYKGTSLMSESTLMDVPTGIVTFHMDMNEPRVPGKTPFIVCMFIV